MKIVMRSILGLSLLTLVAWNFWGNAFLEKRAEQYLFAMQACNTDADCTYIDKACCGCGEMIAMNAKNSDAYRERLNCMDVQCHKMLCEVGSGPVKCINFRCQ